MYKLTVFIDSTRKILSLQYKIMKNKENLRKWAKTQRQSGMYAGVDETILKNLIGFGCFKNAKNVMLFYPLRHELNLLSLLSIS